MSTETTTIKCLGCGRIETNETPERERRIGIHIEFAMYDGVELIACKSQDDNSAYYCTGDTLAKCRYEAFKFIQAKIIERMREQESVYRDLCYGKH